MGKCCVPFCKRKATFTFPKDEKRRVLWEKAISVNFRSSKSSRLCSNHFEKDVIVEKNESYYTGIISFKKTLKPNAVPTLMLELETEKSKRSQKIRETLFEENSNDSNSSLCLSLLDNS
ncbi:GSCOCG00012881001-RA-CDS, partial [Cotesia congregata]